MMKLKKDDADSKAKVDVDATGLGADGIFTITLTSTITKDLLGLYHYEIVWLINGGGIYVLDSGRVTVIEKLQDDV